MSIPTGNAIYQLLSTNGDGTGTTSQNVNGSVTPVEFSIDAEAGKSYVLRRLNFLMIAANFNNATLYGGVDLSSQTGIKIRVENGDGETVKNYTPIPIKRNNDWAMLAGVDATSVGSAGADPFTVRWTFSKGSDDITLNGDKGEKLIVEIAANLSTLAEHIMMVQGFWRDNKLGSNLNG